jgi:hypothetical protein
LISVEKVEYLDLDGDSRKSVLAKIVAKVKGNKEFTTLSLTYDSREMALKSVASDHSLYSLNIAYTVPKKK